MAVAARELPAQSGAKDVRKQKFTLVREVNTTSKTRVIKIYEGAKPFAFQPSALPDRTVTMPPYDAQTQTMPPLKNGVDGCIYPSVTDNNDRKGDKD